MSARRVRVFPAIVTGLLLALGPGTALAKEKTAPLPQTPGMARADVAWLDKAQVQQLLHPGVFWCAEPEGQTCTFAAIGIEETPQSLVYEVVGLWDQEIIIREIRRARLLENGTICESTAIDLSGVRLTDLTGQPLDAADAGPILRELYKLFADPEEEEACFRYKILDPETPNMVTQYEVSPTRASSAPTLFNIDFSADAEAQYSFRLQ